MKLSRADDEDKANGWSWNPKTLKEIQCIYYLIEGKDVPSMELEELDAILNVLLFNGLLVLD